MTLGILEGGLKSVLECISSQKKLQTIYVLYSRLRNLGVTDLPLNLSGGQAIILLIHNVYRGCITFWR